jgi:hypothetical protein
MPVAPGPLPAPLAGRALLIASCRPLSLTEARPPTHGPVDVDAASSFAASLLTMIQVLV